MNTTTLSTEVLTTLATSSADRALKAYRRAANWLNNVEAHINDGADYPSLRSMPSKDAKHRMYGDMHAVCQFLEIEGPESMAECMAVLHLAKGAGLIPMKAKIPVRTV
jgi:hypothetical protein